MTKDEYIGTDIKKGYLTGFFDAEGTVDITEDYVLSAAIVQAYKPILERINQEFKTVSGIKVHSKEEIKNGVHHKGAWRWRVHSDNAIPFLEYVYEYSREKRPQVELALKYQKETKTSHKRSRRGSMFRLSQTEIEQREWYRKEITRLKYETPDEKTLRNYDNEIKKLKIPRDVREGKQLIISKYMDRTYADLDEIYEMYGVKKDTDPDIQIPQHFPNMSSDIETGYLSGFFDGEGYVGISKGKKGDYTMRVSVRNSNFNILKLHEAKFGGSIRPIRKYDEYHKKLYQWDIDHNYSIPFLKLIHNWTFVKSEQIKYAIEFQEWHNKVGIIKTPEEKRKAEWYYNTLQELKKVTGEESIEYLYEEDIEESPLNTLADY